MTAADRIRLAWFLLRLDYHLGNLPGRRRREIRRELKTDTAEAAAQDGGREAVAALGHPRVLAEGFLAAETRPLPHYQRGALWAVACLAAYVYLVMSYGFGLMDGAAATGEHIQGGLPGVTVAAGSEATALWSEYTFSGWVALIPAVAFILGAKLWRLLSRVRPPVQAG